jgi:two-component system CheB/CheR fusion protein
VDDNVDAVRGLALLLQLRGYRVLTAHDGGAGVDVARAQHPEVAILDIGLPKLDGYQVAQELRRQGGSSPPLLIAVTGYGQEEYRQRSRRAGFDYHLVKPVDPDVLARLIERPAAPPSEGRGQRVE